MGLIHNSGGVIVSFIELMANFGDLVGGLIIVNVGIVVSQFVSKIIVFITGVGVVMGFENVGGRDKRAWVMGGFNLTMHGICGWVRIVTKRERFVKGGAIRELGDAVDRRKNFGLQWGQRSVQRGSSELRDMCIGGEE